MNSFLKIVLLVILAIVAVKLLPLTLGLVCLLGSVLFGLIGLGVSAIAILLGALLVFAVLLSPIWVPILLIVLIVALVKRDQRPPVTS